MLCDECGKRPAAVHITKVENGKKTDIHLCEQCASPSFSINDLLTGFLKSGNVFPLKVDVASDVKCNVCGLTYSMFRESGRFGCSNCYKTFGEKLNPLFKKVHGNTTHTGKVPAKAGGKIKALREIEKLKQELNTAVKNEEYEKAASLRDQIRALSQR